MVNSIAVRRAKRCPAGRRQDCSAARHSEQLVPRTVAEAVVDHLEAVDVQDQHEKAGLVPPLSPARGVLEAVEEERAFGKR